MANLVIKNLKASVNGIEILKGINLEMDLNEIHALLGPNGHGKSTLLGVLMGNPKYEVTEGTITWDGEDLLAMSVDERSRKGLFLAMQYPPEISGVSLSDFLRSAMNSRSEKPVSLYNLLVSNHSAEGMNIPTILISMAPTYANAQKEYWKPICSSIPGIVSAIPLKNTLER